MIKLPRLLQSTLTIILLVSVFALAFVAYTQHEEQQHWKSKYIEAFQTNPQLVGIPVTLLLSRFGNVTDILATKFLNDSKEKIEPLAIGFAKGSGVQPFHDFLIVPSSDSVTFWFEKGDINSRIWIRLPSWSDYLPFWLPFVDWQPVTPLGYDWQYVQ
jgi:hypothetical protein